MCAGYERVTSAFLRPGELKQDRTVVCCLAVCQKNFQEVFSNLWIKLGICIGPSSVYTSVLGDNTHAPYGMVLVTRRDELLTHSLSSVFQYLVSLWPHN